MPFRVRARTLDDISAIPALLRRVYPHPHGREDAWSERNLLRHLAHFAAGQFVAEAADGAVIGTAACLRLDLARALAPHTWNEITGEGSLATHLPGGEALYGVNLAVDPGWQGRGVGRALHEARVGLARRLGCRAFVAAGRPAGYAAAAAELAPDAYLGEVAAGNRFDAALTKQVALGFEVKGLLRDYAPDPETLGHAALIVLWL